jgi:Mn2+/Fe2+ NRAMP family transporter
MEVEDKKTRIKHFFLRWLVRKQELTDMKEDVTIGMFLSNAVMWFIIVATAVTLHANGLTTVATAKDAAEALRPFVGDAAYLIFTLGVISLGLLAIPVLAGASSYALAEIFDWKEGLNKTFHQASQFYLVIIVSTLVGLLIPLLGIDPIKALFYTGVFFGITAPLLIFVILHVANNKKVMGKYVNSPITNFFGYLTFVIMALAVIAVAFL